jgi:serine/threonine protein phosphatase PrpC
MDRDQAKPGTRVSLVLGGQSYVGAIDIVEPGYNDQGQLDGYNETIPMHTSLYNQYVQQAEARSYPPRIFSWEQAALGSGLAVIGYLFVRLGNGFPPHVWGEFAQFVMGQRIGQLFGPVLLQSFLYLVGWLLLLLTGLHVLRPGYLSPLHQGGAHERVVLAQSSVQAVSLALPSRRGRASRSAVYKPDSINRPPLPASQAWPDAPTVDRQEAQGSKESASPGLLTQFVASSSEYIAPTTFRLRSEIASPGPATEAARAALGGAFLCRPGSHADGKGVEDALMIASGLCHAPTYAASSDLAHFTLFIIASGHSDERLQQAASRICVQAISYALCRALTKNASFTTAGIESLLDKSIQRTNAMFYQHNQKYQSTSAATVTAILIVSGIAYIAHAGNHRAYLYRPHKGFKLLTRASAAEPGEASRSSDGDDILGQQALVRVQTQQVQLQADDLLILCSNGFWQRVSQAAFLRLMQNEIASEQPAAAQICRALLCLQQGSDGDEPVSAIVARASLL